MKLTVWYPGNIKPVRAGWYERKYDSGLTYMSMWNGMHWLAYMSTKFPAATQDLQWRGVKK